ncbi:MAG: DNA/RNA non-specific endonuclease [Bacteroidales bacterium]|nr:DNA/RNA non-specific endonuclease [Bacteroidales bacterium]
MKTGNIITRVLAVSLFAAAALSCGRKDEVEFKVDVRHVAVESDRGTQFVTVSAPAGQEWTITLTDENGQPVDWAVVDPASGVGTRTAVTITWDQNYTSEARTIVITCRSDSKTSSVKVVQAAKPADAVLFPDKIQPDPVRRWMELPATNNESLYFISHPSSTSETAGRNYSYYWDVANLVAHWVAYPLNKNLIGSGGRTNLWGLDPKLPKDKQPWLFSGYRSSASSGNSDGGTQWYDRGHQMPSADRLNYSDNIQTFYGTNMTPQINELNSNIWAALEGSVRDWSKKFDTLYVVTGCVIDGSTQFAYDNEGKKVTVPVGYYKALLGYDKKHKNGIAAQTQGYTGVAFYFEHKGYPDSQYMNQAMTIDELEKKVGEDFFVNLPSEIGEVLAAKVESTKDNFWWSK